jgi:putative ABC transport system permease protein
MIQNYFKIAWRNLIQNKSFTFINLIGLASGFAITLLIVQYVRFELSYEDSHKNADSIVRLTVDYLNGETVETQDCENYAPVGPKALSELSEVIDFSRANDMDLNTIKVGDNQFELEKGYAVDSSFFTIFSYPLLYGNKENLFRQPDQVVLTRSAAKKYFNRENVIGEIIEIPTGDKYAAFDIVGVVEDAPRNTHFKFDILISYLTVNGLGEKDDNWNGNNNLTYVQLAPNTDYEKFTRSLASFSQRLVDEEKIKNEVVIGQKIADIHLYSHKTFETEPNGNATSVYLLLGVAFLVIISAFVNYINLATSKALDRAKEVGVRKVVGSTKNQLRLQFLTESFLINLFSAILAIGFIWLTKSKFIDVSGLPEGYAIFGDLFFWGTLSSFIVLGIILSGLYPAFVLSSFKPASVLKGNFTHSTQGILLRKSLVVFQFSITIILLIQTFTVKEQLEFMRNKDLGMKIDRTIVVRSPAQNDARQNYNAFKQEMLRSSNVEFVSMASVVPGQPSSKFSTTTGINLTQAINNFNYNFYLDEIDADFIPSMKMEIIAGRNFDETNKPRDKKLIVNEEAIRLWGISSAEEAIGKQLNFWGENDWTIIGVLKNYNQESSKSAQIPIIHRFHDYFSELAVIKFTEGNPANQVKQLKKVYKSHFSGAPFSFFFLDQEFDKQYKDDERFQNVFHVLTGFSILIACLGLFGLASFTVSKRKKEIGIRKVIGASVLNIFVLLTKNFVQTVFISVIIGIPVTYFLATKWLENFAVRIELNWWLFAIPIVLVLLLVIISVGVKTVSTAMANPILSLKDE